MEHFFATGSLFFLSPCIELCVASVVFYVICVYLGRINCLKVTLQEVYTVTTESVALLCTTPCLL